MGVIRDNIFLIGPMGAGKTAVGRRLSRQLGRTFTDSDSVIEERTGVDIAYIFDKEGEEGFRQRETDALAELTRGSEIVLATGGGAILDAENRSNLAARGFVIYLDTSIEQQLKRTRRADTRPLLNTDDPRATLTELMEIRDPLYREIANLIVETDNRSVPSVTKEILEQLTSPD